MSSKFLLSIGAVVLFLIGLVLFFFAFVYLTAAPSAGGSAGTAAVLGAAGLIWSPAAPDSCTRRCAVRRRRLFSK